MTGRAVVGAFWGSIGALRQDELRRFIGYMNVAQMSLEEHRPLDSEQAAEKALAIEPNAPNAWAALAAAELAEDDPIGARRDATQALTLLHDYPWALDTRAQAAERSGDLPAAHTDRERIATLARGPADDDTARAARLLTSGAP